MDQRRWNNRNAIDLLKKKQQKTQWLSLIFKAKKSWETKVKKLEEFMKEMKIIKQQNLHYKDEDYIKCIERQIDNLLIDEDNYQK